MVPLPLTWPPLPPVRASCRWGFWVHPSYYDASQPHNLTIGSESGATLSVSVTTQLFVGQELGVQFPGAWHRRHRR